MKVAKSILLNLMKVLILYFVVGLFAANIIRNLIPYSLYFFYASSVNISFVIFTIVSFFYMLSAYSAPKKISGDDKNLPPHQRQNVRRYAIIITIIFIIISLVIFLIKVRQL